MTIDIEIGILEPVEPEAAPYEGFTEWIKREVLDEAPCFPGAIKSAHTNLIMIGLFGKAARIARDAFPAGWLDDRKIQIVKVTSDTLGRIQMAIDALRREYPHAEPNFESDDIDLALARLMVCEWWIRYAIRKYGRKARMIIS